MFRYIGVVIVMAVFGYAWYYVSNLNSTIDELSNSLDNNISKINNLKLQLAIIEANNNKLEELLKEANKNIEAITLKKEELKKNIQELKNINVKTVIKNNELKELLDKPLEYKKSCEYGLELNNAIKGLKYEDLH